MIREQEGSQSIKIRGMEDLPIKEKDDFDENAQVQENKSKHEPEISDQTPVQTRAKTLTLSQLGSIRGRGKKNSKSQSHKQK